MIEALAFMLLVFTIGFIVKSICQFRLNQHNNREYNKYLDNLFYYGVAGMYVDRESGKFTVIDPKDLSDKTLTKSK